MTNIGGLAAKLRAMKEKQAAAKAEEDARIQAKAQEHVERVNATIAEAQASDPYFVREGVAELPSNWWGANRDHLVEAIGSEAVEAFNVGLIDLLNANRANLREASSRLQQIIRNHSGSEILLNPAIMRAIVEKLQSGYVAARIASTERASTAARNKVATASAKETLDMLLGD